MESNWSMAPKNFTGTLSKDNDQVNVVFIVGVDAAGEVVITFSRFPLDKSSAFISKNFHVTSTHFAEFCLSGIATDGTTFECDNVIFTRLGEKYEQNCRTIAPEAHYSLAKLNLAGDPVESPTITWRLKGFESFRPLVATCPLGTVEMLGAKEKASKNELSGLIRVTASSAPQNLEDWRTNVTSLCDHLRHVMSFAACVYFACPIMEFSHEGLVRAEAYSQSPQEKSECPAFSPLHLNEIFKCAVSSYFEPAFEVKNLFFAIKWFTMRAFYREAHLISSMTVLENLIDSNLSDEDTLLLSEKTFQKLRKKLSIVIKEQVTEWTDDLIEQQEFVQELNNRFADLKRRSLNDKIALLAKRWGVKLDDIPVTDIREAKTARDHVVHRGHYEPKISMTSDLYDHVLTVRELVVRFILTALQFEGTYMSYRGGYHSRVFEMNPADLEYKIGWQIAR
jgi:hypothetical protein